MPADLLGSGAKDKLEGMLWLCATSLNGAVASLIHTTAGWEFADPDNLQTLTIEYGHWIGHNFSFWRSGRRDMVWQILAMNVCQNDELGCFLE